MRVRLVVTMLAVLTLSGCGRFVSSETAQRATTTTTGASVDVGSPGLTATSTPTTTPTTTSGGPASTGAAGPATTRATAAAQAPPANVRQRTDPSGLRLTIVVGGTLRYGPKEDIVLQLDVENTTSKPLDLDPNEPRSFLITPRTGNGPSWRNVDCAQRPPPEHRAPVLTLEPGETVAFQATYPVKPVPGSDRGDRCRVPRGDYAAFGVAAWCPPGAKTSGDTCDPARTTLISSPGVPITIS